MDALKRMKMKKFECLTQRLQLKKKDRLHKRRSQRIQSSFQYNSSFSRNGRLDFFLEEICWSNQESLFEKETGKSRLTGKLMLPFLTPVFIETVIKRILFWL